MTTLRITFCLLFSAFVLVSCGGGSAPTPAKVNAIASSGGSMPSMINSLRKENGLSPLRVDSQLTQLAKSHALDMARNGKFSHTGSDGSDYQTRMARAGIPAASVKTATENVGHGSSDPAVVFPAWVKSSHHRSNSLQSNHTRMGIAEAGGYWCAIFAE